MSINSNDILNNYYNEINNKKYEKWTREEDNKLKNTVEKLGEKNWKKIANEIGSSKNEVQCLHRWKKVLLPGLVKGPWTAEEDAIILKAVKDAGNLHRIKWCDVASKLEGRIGKQCRERYYNYLDSNIKRTSWTEEEDKILFELQYIIGNRWCEIAKVLPGRSENNIKNRFNSKARYNYIKKYPSRIVSKDIKDNKFFEEMRHYKKIPEELLKNFVSYLTMNENSSPNKSKNLATLNSLKILSPIDDNKIPPLPSPMKSSPLPSPSNLTPTNPLQFSFNEQFNGNITIDSNQQFSIESLIIEDRNSIDGMLDEIKDY